MVDGRKTMDFFRCKLMRFQMLKAQGVWRKAERTKLSTIVIAHLRRICSIKKMRNIG